MSSIYSSLPNPRGDLKGLQTEFGFLFNFFNGDKIKKKVDFGYSDKQTIDELTTEIIKRQKTLRLFHFSGHSGVSGLQFTDAQFDDEHVSKFFNTICSEKNHIECVFLNGCENETIVHQLTNVPVVIGTKTKIEDKTASKFTENFFSALIGGENSYGKAFEIAKVAMKETAHIQDRTDVQRGIRIEDRTKPLDQYFMVVHKSGFAERKFPFKRGKVNWTKYLLLFLIVVALGTGYFFKDSIFKRVGGYSCDKIKTQEGKCNFVIGDFATIPKMDDFNQWLYGNIRNAALIQDYLHAINIETFDNVIHNNSVDRDSLPAYCNYDFNLTGSITGEGNGLRAEFNVFPYVAGAKSPGLFVYSVSSLGSLDTLISTLNEKNARQFVLYEMCISCALKRNMPGLPRILQDLAETFDTSHSSAMYQRLQYSLVDVNLQYADTSAALLSLERISKAAGNDLALMAMERKIELYFKSNDLLQAYQSQSLLVNAIQARVQQPDQFELSADLKQYAAAENRLRMTRAELVLKNQNGALSGYKTEAVKDLEYLQRIKYQSRDFTRELRQLKSAQLKDVRNPPTEKFQFSGSVYAENGRSLEGASVTYENQQLRTDAKGRFDFGTHDKAQVFGKQLQISHAGFQDKVIEINERTIGKITLTASTSARPPETYRVHLQAVKVDRTNYQKILSSLKSAGHPIGDKLSNNYEAPPENFSKVPTIMFYDEGNRERVITLARQLQNWTKQEFEIRLVSGSLIRETRSGISPGDIIIQWVHAK